MRLSGAAPKRASVYVTPGCAHGSKLTALASSAVKNFGIIRDARSIADSSVARETSLTGDRRCTKLFPSKHENVSLTFKEESAERGTYRERASPVRSTSSKMA